MPSLHDKFPFYRHYSAGRKPGKERKKEKKGEKRRKASRPVGCPPERGGGYGPAGIRTRRRDKEGKGKSSPLDPIQICQNHHYELIPRLWPPLLALHAAELDLMISTSVSRAERGGQRLPGGGRRPVRAALNAAVAVEFAHRKTASWGAPDSGTVVQAKRVTKRYSWFLGRGSVWDKLREESSDAGTPVPPSVGCAAEQPARPVRLRMHYGLEELTTTQIIIPRQEET